MSFTVGGSKTDEKKQQSSQVDPWAPTKPLLNDVIGQLTSANKTYDPSGQNAALDDMAATWKTGTNSTADMTRVGKDAVATPDRTGVIDSAGGDLRRRLDGTADGNNLDLSKNTYLQDMLAKVRGDATNSVNAQFAGAGRDMSGINQKAVGEGVGRAELPLLLEQFNREQGRTDAAGRDLHAAGVGGAQTQTQMDVARAKLREGGALLQNQAFQQNIDNGRGQFDLQTLRQQLPYQQLGWLTQLLNPIAGLGQQSSGQSSGTKTQIGGSATAKIV